MGCARYVPVVPGKDIVVRCTRCDITRAFPLSEVMAARHRPICQGEVEVCQAVLFTPEDGSKVPPKSIIEKAKDALKR